MNMPCVSMCLTKLRADVPELLRVVICRRCPGAIRVNPAEEPLVVLDKICTWERRNRLNIVSDDEDTFLDLIFLLEAEIQKSFNPRDKVTV